MGAKGIRKRKRARRLPKVRGRDTGLGPWELQHSPYTIEGEIEGFRNFARGATSALRGRRPGGAVSVLWWLGIVVLGILVVLALGTAGTLWLT